MSLKKHSRRAVLQAVAATAAIGNAALARAQAAPAVEELPIDYFDPFTSPQRYIERRALYFHTPTTARTFARLWAEYEKTKDPKYGEWALIFLLPWWRSEARRAERLKITKVAERACAKYISEQNPAPGGLVWQAVLKSCQVATIGLLDSAHMLPAILETLEKAENQDRPYYKGIINLARAKIYYKAPAFPASLGDMPRAIKMLAAAEDAWASKLGVWWNLAAEIEHINGNSEKAIELSTGIEKRVNPPDLLLAYSLDTAVFDAYELVKAIKTGTYSRYLFDPFFLQTKPGLQKTWKPA